VHALFSFCRPVFYFPLGCMCMFCPLSCGFRSYFALFSHCYIRLESFCMHIVVFASIFTAGASFKVFNIPEYFNWHGLYLLVLRFCNDAVISRPLFEFFTLVPVVFWLVIFFRFRLIICQLGC
jgi:hypothetical protein